MVAICDMTTTRFQNYIPHDTVHKAFFTFKISYGFTLHVYKWVHVCPYDKYSLPYTDFLKPHKCWITYVQISYNEFHPNKTNNVEDIHRNSFTPLSKDGFHCANFHKSRSCSMILSEIFCTEFFPSQKNVYKIQTKLILCSTAK